MAPVREWQFDGHQAGLVFDGARALVRIICPHGAGVPLVHEGQQVPACRTDETGLVVSGECQVYAASVACCDEELWDPEETDGFRPQLMPFPVAWRLDGDGFWVKPAQVEPGWPCPSGCDADCDAHCHEEHQVSYKRLHPAGEHPRPASTVDACAALLESVEKTGALVAFAKLAAAHALPLPATRDAHGRPLSPNRVLAARLEQMRMPAGAAAFFTGISVERMARLLAGDVELGPTTALNLVAATGIPVEAWQGIVADWLWRYDEDERAAEAEQFPDVPASPGAAEAGGQDG